MSNVSSHGRVSGTVRSIVCVETTLPSTLNVPVPPRPRPLMLLNASVAKPSPSYLKSYSSVCLPTVSTSGPSQRTRLRSKRFHRNTGLPFSRLQQVQPVSAEPPAIGDDHAEGQAGVPVEPLGSQAGALGRTG